MVGRGEVDWGDRGPKGELRGEVDWGDRGQPGLRYPSLLVCNPFRMLKRMQTLFKKAPMAQPQPTPQSKTANAFSFLPDL